MSPLFSGINLALQAMLAHQQAMEIIEHNVANANTPGYHRQQAVLVAGLPYPAPRLQGGIFPGQMGSGVLVDSIRRFNLDFFDGRYRKELSESKRWSMEGDVLNQVEATLAETDNDGVAAKLDEFWSGWQALSSDPTNMALRADLRQRASALADSLNWRANALMELRKNQDLTISQKVNDINAMASQIAHLNVEISNVQAAGDAPNDLLDQRDQLMDGLAEITGATVSIQDNGEALVSINGHALVVGSEAFALAANPDPANGNMVKITWAGDGKDFDPQRGELAGLLDARDRVIPAQLDALNSVAFSLADRVNTLHQGGYGLNNATGLNFFEPFTSTNYALEIHVSSDIDDLANIAASTDPDSPGNGNLAGEIANVKDEMLMNGGTATLNSFYVGKIGEFGLAVQEAQIRAADRGSVADSLMKLKESATGVNLDEEAANLIKEQRAFEAAARMLTAMDDMLDRVINGLGLVGR